MSGPPASSGCGCATCPASSATSAWAAAPARPPARSRLESEFDLGMTGRKAISGPSPTRCRRPSPSTTAAGSLHLDLPCAHLGAGVHRPRRPGRWEEAYRVASEPNPFPSVCGRICPHACEEECTRGRLDEPVAIAGIKRFVADQVGRRSRWRRSWSGTRTGWRWWGRDGRAHRGPRPGPARLSGHRLRGPAVAGGMLALGVPEYRLPREVVAAEVARVLAGGVELRPAALRPRLHRGLAARLGVPGGAPRRGAAAAAPAPAARGGAARGDRWPGPAEASGAGRCGRGGPARGGDRWATSPSTRPGPRSGSAPSA